VTTRELLIKINGDNSGLNNALIKSEQDLNAIKKNAQATAKVFTDFGKTMSMSVTLPIIAVGAAIVKSTSDMEMQAAALETMLGSAGAAAKMIAQIKIMAAKTPFSSSDLTDATKTLLQFGLDAESVLPTINQLGDVSSGNAQRLKQLTLAFGQMSSAGRLMGQDLLQMINAGFNPLKVISEKTGESMASLKERMAAGGVSAQEVAEAFKIATSEGGLFYKGMDRASKTLSGQFSTLMDEVAELGRSFGEILLPYLKDLVTKATEAVKSFAGLDESQRKTILVIAALAASIGPLSLAIGGVIKTINTFKGVMMLAGGPAGWITLAAIAVAALGIAMGTVIKKNVELQKIYSGKSEAPIANQLAMIEEQAKLTNKEYDDFIAKTKDLTTVQKDRGKELDRLNKLSLYGGEAGIKKEKQRLERVKEIQKATIEELKKKVDAEKAAQDEASGLGKGVEDLTEAEEEYAKAMDIATSAIEKNITEEERLGRQFDILQNLKTTSSKDEENRLKALAIIRQQIFDIQMKEMEDLAAANADNGSTLEDGIESNHEYSDSLKQLIEDVKSLDEEQADAKKKTEEFRKKVQEISATVVSFIGPLVELGAALGGDAEDLAAFGAIATDAINGIAAAISGNIIGAVIAAIGLVTKLINLFKKKSEAAREAKRSTESYMDTVTSGEGKLIRFVNIIGGAFQSIIGNFKLSFDKASLEALRTLTAFKELAASYGDSIGKTLGDAMIKGMSKVNFMAEIGKILINAMIAAALATGPIAAAMAAIGEKIAYMVVNGFTDEGMAEVEQMASDLYDIFSTGVLPIVQKIRDIFGQDSASEETGSFASGVTNFRGGIARVGEQGPETVRLPRGSSVEPNGMGRSGGITMTFNSPRALSPMETKRAMLAAGRQLAFETGGNF
jgi:tape measure domain-containing protein